MVLIKIEIPKTSSLQTCLLVRDWLLFVPACTETLALLAQNSWYYHTTLVLYTFYLKMHGSSKNLRDNSYGTPNTYVIVIYLGRIQPLHFIEDCNITEPGKTYRARLYYSPRWNEAVELDPGQQLFDAQGFCQYKDLKFIIKWKIQPECWHWIISRPKIVTFSSTLR